MKKFALKSFIFLFILACLIAAINSFYYSNYLRYMITSRGYDEYRSLDKNIDILFLGDSRTLYGINPKYISKPSFNYASPGENYLVSYYKFKELLNEGRMDLKMIVLPVDLHSFVPNRSYNFSHERDWYYGKFINFFELAFAEKSIYYFKHEFLSRMNFLGKGFDILKTFKNVKLKSVYFGHVDLTDNYSEEKNKSAIAKKAAKGHLRYINEDNGPGELSGEILSSYLEKIIHLAEENGIKVALIKLPVTGEYLSASEKYIPDRHEYYKALDKYEGMENVYLFDFQQSIADDSLFADSNHLNISGATIFSMKLEEVLPEL